VGSPAPDFDLQDAQTGQAVRLSSFGGKPVWINFWATWCDACREEMPDIQQVYSEYKNRDLVILGVNIQEKADVVNSFVTSKGYGWTFLLDSEGKVTDLYFVAGIPTNIFIDTDGVIRAIHVGALRQEDARSNLLKIIP
jgi:thiol-disulfide isomerase/thioredoxin